MIGIPPRPFAAMIGLLALAVLQAPAHAQTGGYTFQTAPVPTPNYLPMQLLDNMRFVGGNYIFTPGQGYITYNYPGAGRTRLVGMNNNQYVLGQAYPSSDPNSTNYQPFLWAGGNPLPASAASLRLNTSFKTVDFAFDQVSGNTLGSIYTVNSNAVTSFLIFGNGWASGINDNNQVVGTGTDTNGYGFNFIRNPDGSIVTFPKLNGTAGSLNAWSIANGPLVAGLYSDNSTGTNSIFVRAANGTTTIIRPPGGRADSFPYINNLGVIMGVLAPDDGSARRLYFAYPPGYSGPLAF